VNLSVVMAVRNGEPFLKDAIESVLAQSVSDFELLIVDDASTDETPGTLSRYARQDSRIRVLRNERNLGPYPSANRALMQARGDFVARHDADDLSPRDRFAIQLDAVRSGDAVSLVTGAVEAFGGEEIPIYSIAPPPRWQPRMEWELLFGNIVGAGSHVMFPRVFRGMPTLFPARYPYAEDYGLWCTLSRAGRVSCPPEIVYRYRQHAASITVRKKHEQAECLSKIRQAHQARYLPRDSSPDAAADVSRFWLEDGSRPLGADAGRVYSTLEELRSRFLAYVEGRYGAEERAALDAELDEAFGERLGYWLYRSVRLRDAPACRAMLAAAAARGQSMNVSAKACGQLVSALRRKLGRRPRVRPR